MDPGDHPPEGQGTLASLQDRSGALVITLPCSTLFRASFCLFSHGNTETRRHHFQTKRDFSQEVCRPDTFSCPLWHVASSLTVQETCLRTIDNCRGLLPVSRKNGHRWVSGGPRPQGRDFLRASRSPYRVARDSRVSTRAHGIQGPCAETSRA